MQTLNDDIPEVGGCGPACTTRRAFLAGAAGAAAAAVLSACATYGAQPPADPGVDEPDPEDPSDDVDGGGDGGRPALAKVADIPVGGGIVLEGRRMVITQPKAGTIKAFTAVCTHQGCTVADVSNGTINCPCHGSRFKVADGSVANGPATRALRQISVTVDGADIKLA
jgi:Rieske Fe-S protein